MEAAGAKADADATRRVAITSFMIDLKIVMEYEVPIEVGDIFVGERSTGKGAEGGTHTQVEPTRFFKIPDQTLDQPHSQWR